MANVSHELRTPLNMIIGFSEMMTLAPATYGQALPKALLSDLGVIYRNSLHLSQLINDVLILSQMEAGQMRLSRTWVDVGELVNEAVQAVEPLYKAKNLALITTLPTALPSIFCDRLRIRQVLLNLLSNAGRYTVQGRVQLEVTLDQQHFTFAVRDTGPGIAPIDQRRIFEPFHQSSATTAQGTESGGLGLTISRQLVELHKGTMWLESVVGDGSTFCFTLPITLPDPATADPAPITRWINPYSVYTEGERRTLPSLPAATERILVLEATEDLAHQLEPFLEEVEVVPVADVDELKTASQATPPAMVLVNHAAAMADQRFGQLLPELPQRTPIISCYLPGKAEACQQLKVVDYLIKPVTRKELIGVVTQAVGAESTILLVEDEAELARLLRRQLRSTAQHYRVLQAADGNMALALMRSRQPDLVLLDLGLPDRDGYDILQEKNGDPQIAAIPVVIISARDPVGGPALASRLRVELVGGLSVRDIATCVAAISQALSPLQRLKPSMPLRSSPD
ncbi:MAG: ATP-binding protein [Caldilineaceae bacterium]